MISSAARLVSSAGETSTRNGRGTLVKPNVAKLLPMLCLLVLPALTQEFRSTISGHVTDASGAAVPGAKITAVNSDNNESTTATTDNAGAYAIPFLRPGNYKVTAT